MNVLLTAIGKRVQLIQHLKTQFRVIGTDVSPLNPAKEFTDVFYLVPGCREPDYIKGLLKICRKEQVDLLIPLYEPEFLRLCETREQFEAAGVRLILSDQEVIRICNDKYQTAAFFDQYQIPAPITYDREKLLDPKSCEWEYPLIIKPLNGMGSEGVFQIHNSRELEFFLSYVEYPIIQECVQGTEYTVDVLCDLNGHPVYIVPRIRLEVRSGEVVKSRTCRQELVIRETTALLEKLNREGTVIGPMTIQCFLSEDLKSLSFIEINPRFGGGVPLSFAAGADYATALKAMAEGREVPYKGEGIRQLTMMRYDQAVFEE